MNLPSLPVIPSALPSVFREEKFPPRQRRTNAPTLRFTPFKVYGCHPARRRGTQAFTGGDTDTPRFLATVPGADGQSLAEMIRQNPPPGFRFSEPFGHSRLAAEDASMITAW